MTDERIGRIAEIFRTDDVETRALVAIDGADAVAQLAEDLAVIFKRDRIPDIVRRPNPALDGCSVLEAITLRGVASVRGALERLTSYVPPPDRE